MKTLPITASLLFALMVASCSDHEPPSETIVLGESCDVKFNPYCNIEEFQKLPIQGRLDAASAVILTENKIERNEIREYVKEVLKLNPGTTLYMKPGTLVKTHPNLPNTNYGDGSIALLRGSPASVVESYSYENGMISGLGNMPVTELKRAVVAQSKPDR